MGHLPESLQVVGCAGDVGFVGGGGDAGDVGEAAAEPGALALGELAGAEGDAFAGLGGGERSVQNGGGLCVADGGGGRGRPDGMRLPQGADLVEEALREHVVDSAGDALGKRGRRNREDGAGGVGGEKPGAGGLAGGDWVLSEGKAFEDALDAAGVFGVGETGEDAGAEVLGLGAEGGGAAFGEQGGVAGAEVGGDGRGAVAGEAVEEEVDVEAGAADDEKPAAGVGGVAQGGAGGLQVESGAARLGGGDEVDAAVAEGGAFR